MSNAETTEDWFRRLEVGLDGSPRELAAPLGVLPAVSVPDGFPVARLARHAEDLLAELPSLMPEARVHTEAELERTLAALPADYQATFRLLRRDLAMLDGSDEADGSPVPADVGARVARAWMTRDWMSLLALLRAAPQVHPEARRAYGRGRAWGTLGYKRAAVPFFEHAVAVEKSATFFAGLLDALHTAGRTAEAAELAEPALDDPHVLIALSAIRARFVAVSLEPASRREVEYTALLGALDRVLPRARSAAREHGAVFHSMLSNALVIRGFALDHLSRHDEADAAFTEAISAHDDVSQRVARGMHRVRYGGDAKADLERAIEGDLAFVPAYLFLANLHLNAREFAACKDVCERALQWPADIRVEAMVREMLAIALAEGTPPELRRALEEMERALALTPNEPRIVTNLEELRAMSQSPARRLTSPELSLVRAASGQAVEAVSMALVA